MKGYSVDIRTIGPHAGVKGAFVLHQPLFTKTLHRYLLCAAPIHTYTNLVPIIAVATY